MHTDTNIFREMWRKVRRLSECICVNSRINILKVKNINASN
jgi:hypothetical protein